MEDKNNNVKFDNVVQISKSEYEATYAKARNIDNKVNLLLTISLAILTALLSLADFSLLTKFYDADLQTIALLIFYITFSITFISLFVVMLILMLKILTLRDYAVFNINMFDTNFFMEINKLSQIGLDKIITDEYKNCTNINQKSNEKKQKLYSIIIKILPYTIIVTILCFLIKFFI